MASDDMICKKIWASAGGLACGNILMCHFAPLLWLQMRQDGSYFAVSSPFKYNSFCLK
jgi:hypothetical protein